MNERSELMCGCVNTISKCSHTYSKSKGWIHHTNVTIENVYQCWRLSGYTWQKHRLTTLYKFNNYNAWAVIQKQATQPPFQLCKHFSPTNKVDDISILLSLTRLYSTSYTIVFIPLHSSSCLICAWLMACFRYWLQNRGAPHSLISTV